jgi:hypothetical protein
VLLSGTFSEAATDGATDGAQVERTATLTSPTTSASKGLARIEIERSGGLSDEQVQVELENMPYPASCRLKLDGYAVVMFSPPADGKVRLKLNRRVTPATRTVAR